jgi:zinc protease
MISVVRKRFLIFCFFAVFAAISASSQETPQKATPPPTAPAAPQASRVALPTIKFEKYALPNGLEVILSEDHRLPLVATDLWYHVGPANELPGRTGFAHLFEHMMFEGSKHVSGNAHIRYLEAAGASDLNGTTDFDRTDYFETLPSNQLELALWLESDRMGYLPDKLDQAKASKTVLTESSKRACFICSSPRATRTTPT